MNQKQTKMYKNQLSLVVRGGQQNKKEDVLFLFFLIGLLKATVKFIQVDLV